MNAEEARSRQPRLESRERVAHEMRVRTDVDLRVIVHRLDPVDVRSADEQQPPIDLDCEPKISALSSPKMLDASVVGGLRARVNDHRRGRGLAAALPKPVLAGQELTPAPPAFSPNTLSIRMTWPPR